MAEEASSSSEAASWTGAWAADTPPGPTTGALEQNGPRRVAMAGRDKNGTNREVIRAQTGRTERRRDGAARDPADATTGFVRRRQPTLAAPVPAATATPATTEPAPMEVMVDPSVAPPTARSRWLLAIGAGVIAAGLLGYALGWAAHRQPTTGTIPDAAPAALPRTAPWTAIAGPGAPALVIAGAASLTDDGAVVLTGGNARRHGLAALADGILATGSLDLELILRSHEPVTAPACLLLWGSSAIELNLAVLLRPEGDGTVIELRLRTRDSGADGLRPVLRSAPLRLHDGQTHLLAVNINDGHARVLLGESLVAEAAIAPLTRWQRQAPMTLGDAPEGGYEWQGELPVVRLRPGRP